MNSGIRISIIVAIFLIGGCRTVQFGGAPEPSFDETEDLAQLEKQFANATSIADFYKNPTEDARNRFIDGRLVLMNIRYIQFIRSFTADKQMFDSATEMLAMSLSLAATAVQPASTKTAFSAIGTGVLGAHDIVDKNYFFKKATPALMSTMDAERKRVLVNILKGRRKDVDKYPITQAITDLYSYYRAGSLQGAIMAIQLEAAEKDSAATKEIQRIADFSTQDLVQWAFLSLTLSRLERTDEAKQITLDQHTAILDTVRQLALSDQARTPTQALGAIRDAIDQDTSPIQINAIAQRLMSNGISPVTKEQIATAIRAITFAEKETLKELVDAGVSFELPGDFESVEAKFNNAKNAVADYIEELTGDGEFDSDVFMAAGQYLINKDMLGN